VEERLRLGLEDYGLAKTLLVSSGGQGTCLVRGKPA